MIVGKIVLYLAMSVDGYIADEQGGVSWLEGDGSKPDTSGSYPAFYETVEDPPAERKSGECLLLEWGTDRPGRSAKNGIEGKRLDLRRCVRGQTAIEREPH